MREPYTQLYLHLVWSTYDRLPLLTPGVRSQVIKSIRGECAGLNVRVFAINAVSDHIHVLVRFSATIVICDLVKQIKGVSSRFASIQSPSPFKWQGGYGAFTIAKRDVSRVVAYIENQEAHHSLSTLIHDLECMESVEFSGSSNR